MAVSAVAVLCAHPGGAFVVFLQTSVLISGHSWLINHLEDDPTSFCATDLFFSRFGHENRHNNFFHPEGSSLKMISAAMP